MVDRFSVASLISSYSLPSDGAACKSFELISMLLVQSPAPFSRNQFTPGHVTTSGLVRSPDGGRMLILHHRRLERWLLPGGHVEPADETIEAAAAREVLEETGLAVLDGQLAGADVHGIPAKHAEPYHLHHDLLFSFQALSEDVRISEESHAVTWCSPGEFDRYAIPPNIRRAWERVTRR